MGKNPFDGRDTSIGANSSFLPLGCHDLSPMADRVPGSGVTEPAEGAPRAKEDGHRGSWLTLSLRT